MNTASAPKIFCANFAKEGICRRVWFESDSFESARDVATSWGVGLLGESQQPELRPEALPEAYDESDARRLLGGISRTTLWRELADGKLERLPGTRRLLVTRSSIETRWKWRAMAGRN